MRVCYSIGGSGLWAVGSAMNDEWIVDPNGCGFIRLTGKAVCPVEEWI